MSKTATDYLKEMQDAVNMNVPVLVRVSSTGELLEASYESEWREGGTTPIDTGKKYPNGEPVYEYKGEYETKKLTAAQAKKLDQYIIDNVAS